MSLNIETFEVMCCEPLSILQHALACFQRSLHIIFFAARDEHSISTGLSTTVEDPYLVLLHLQRCLVSDIAQSQPTLHALVLPRIALSIFTMVVMRSKCCHPVFLSGNEPGPH